MTLYYFFFILTILFFLLFLYFGALLLLQRRLSRDFKRFWNSRRFLEDLRRYHKIAKIPQIQNLLLYFILRIYQKQEEEDKAKKLLPFLKDDPLLGIKKDSLP